MEGASRLVLGGYGLGEPVEGVRPAVPVKRASRFVLEGALLEVNLRGVIDRGE